MDVGEVVAIALAGLAAGRDRHGGRERDPHHLPGALGLRVRAADGQRLEHHRPRTGVAVARSEGGRLTPLGVYAAGVCGDCFGAAQGILLLGILAGVYFAFAAHVEWGGRIIAAASIVGGQLGAHYGRRLQAVLRGVIVVVGGTAIVRLLMT